MNIVKYGILYEYCKINLVHLIKTSTLTPQNIDRCMSANT